MQLRTRIALTFLLLLSAVLATALFAVSAANQANAEREINRQLEVGRLVFERALEANRRQLTQAAQVLASDFGFREAVASHDEETIASALENQSARIGASLTVLLSLDGRVLASNSAAAVVGQPFRHASLLTGGRASERAPTVIVEAGRVYQLVTVAVRSPLPVAWVVMGFGLDQAAVRELSAVTGLDVTIATAARGQWQPTATTLTHETLAPALRQVNETERLVASDILSRSLTLSQNGELPVKAVLSRSLTEARKPFDRLSDRLVVIALVSLSLSAIAAFWLAQNITRPLLALTAAVQRIRRGHYDSDVPVGRADELGTLAEGLQLMRQAVESRDTDIRLLAYTDRLTGIMNRTAFGDALDVTLATPGTRVAVALINIRRFRRINECLGYAVGDEVLRQMATRLKGTPDASGHVARVAADHFAVYRQLPDQVSLEHWGVNLLDHLSEPVLVSGQQVDLSVVIGLAIAPEDAFDADDLMRCADLAVDRARRDNVALRAYDDSLRPATRDQLSLLGELQRAIERDELHLAFQPKLDLRTGAVCGAEALIRWQHPVRGLLPPSAFVPFAEQAGFVRKLTRWVLPAATLIGAEWVARGMPLPISVNISADDLVDPGFDAYVAEALERAKLAPELLVLELTESGFIGDPDLALGRLEALRLLGVGLSIDDFGTGYSSLSYLARMPVDELKIDRSFVMAISTSEEVAAVVRAALDMGHSLGLKVVAEGIEDEASAARLLALGCDVGQGYLYAKPMMQAEFEVWRRNHGLEATADANAPPTRSVADQSPIRSANG